MILPTTPGHGIPTLRLLAVVDEDGGGADFSCTLLPQLISACFRGNQFRPRGWKEQLLSPTAGLDGISVALIASNGE
jgi:hypothetical protein